MREILFRAKTANDKPKWVEGYYDASYDRVPVMQTISDTIPVDPSTLGEFTGITDINGVRIFEGDIIKSVIGNVIVIFKGCGFMGEVIGTHFYYDLYEDNLEFVEVIGNIYDNPELLNY